MQAEPDAELIRRSIGEPDTFELIFERHYDVVRLYAQRRLGHDDGEEIAASTFEQAFEQRGRFDWRHFTSARPWLMGIANNLVRRHLRHADVRQRHWPVSIVMSEVELPPGLEPLEAQERMPAVRAGLSQLSDPDRETFLLLVLGELSYEEVAQIIGVPIGTVRSRVNRARKVLRELIGAAEAINSGEEDSGSAE